MVRDDSVTFRILVAGDVNLLRQPADGVFDNPTREALVREFLLDDRHHIAVAMEGSLVVGVASGVHYVHPDKAAQMFVNEIGVSGAHRG